MVRIGLVCGLLLLCGSMLRAEEKSDREILSALQEYIGDWRGVGQPRRGSSRGAWQQETSWSWKFKDGNAALVFQSPEGKYFESGTLTATGDKEFALVAVNEDGKKATFKGSIESDRLVLVNEKADDSTPARISVRLVAGGKRLMVLYERRLGTTSRFTRLAEVGYTRKGVRLATGPSYPECVVTGGYADRTVEYKGKKYYVCCEGCKQLFEMDPEGVLKEYYARKAEEKKQE